jgi:Zn-finger nucleic acid-binding protein
MLCPRHNLACDTVVLKAITVEVCPACHGVWLEQVEMRKLVQYFSTPAIGLSDEQLARWEETVGNPETAPKDFWQEAELTCAFDGSPMQKHYFAGTTVGMDQCQVCRRIWLDGPEVMAIAKAVGPNRYEDALATFILDEVTYPQIDKIYNQRGHIANSLGIDASFLQNPQSILPALVQMAIGYYLGR